ncbi:MAG: undecaprenyl-diphosphatase, partial [Neolewinella sp.]
PLILGKMAKDLLDGDFSGTVSLPELSIGFVAAFLTGIVACVWMIKLVKRAELKWFAYYCFAVAAIVLIVKATV